MLPRVPHSQHMAGIPSINTVLAVCVVIVLCVSVACGEKPTLEEENISHQYIVMFAEYHWHYHHASILSNILGTEEGFQVIPRNNPAATHYPSDFAVVKFGNHSHLELLQNYKNPSLVKRIVPNRRFHVSQPKPDSSELLCNSTDLLSTALRGRSLLELNPQVHGRMLTRWSQDYFSHNETGLDNVPSQGVSRRRLLGGEWSIAERLNARDIWERGHTGNGVKVAVFDTGLNERHPAFARGDGDNEWTNVEEVINYTSESSTEDYHGHGTFVAGMIGADSLPRSPRCGGLAPGSSLYIFKVFTVDQSSYTSWFLDAFNYALVRGIDVLNLSIGGPDYKDLPFVEKVWELSANNVIVVSAIGNDGPLYGTLNNPADQFDVIGVGGMDNSNRVAQFSSRGITTWEISSGYGRVKPDIVTYGSHLEGPGLSGGCRTLSGTSVASPVVAGAVALLISSVPEDIRSVVINPASMKHILTHSAKRLPGANMFEQGFGRLDLPAAYQMLHRDYVEPYLRMEASFNATPAEASHDGDPYFTIDDSSNSRDMLHSLSFVPQNLDATQCPYSWPYCEQPLYYTSQPFIVNTTLLNSMGSSGRVVGGPRWIARSPQEAAILNVTFTHSDVFWPWTGHVSAFVSVTAAGRDFSGVVKGYFEVEIESPKRPGETEPPRGIGRFNMTLQVAPPPPRHKRVLWDQRHNLQYPIDGYIPRDNLNIKHDILDWNGDHPHTNFRGAFQHLRREGYFVEILTSDYTMFDPSLYGTLLIVDPEAEFTNREIQAFAQAVDQVGLSVAVFADWHNSEVIRRISFWDDNTESQWVPVTGGSNVPALNRLLHRYGIKFGDRVYDGTCNLKGTKFKFGSGTSIVRFPSERAKVYKQEGLVDQTAQILRQRVSSNIQPAVLGLYQTLTGGRIAVYGDSNCIDEVHNDDMCYKFLSDIVRYTSTGEIEGLLAAVTDSDGVYGDPDMLLVQGQYMFPIILSAGLLLVLVMLFVRTRRLHRGMTQTV